MMNQEVSIGAAGDISQDRRCLEGISEARPHNVLELLTQFAQRKRLIAWATAIGTSLGLALCLALPDRYTAVTRLMPPKQTQSTTSFLNSQSGGGSFADLAGGGMLKDPNAIYIGLLKSRPVADAIIARFMLTKVYRSRDMTAAREKLESNTQIETEKSTLISISVTDGDKKRAAAIANAYTELFMTLSKSISVTEASKRRLFFENQLKDQKEALVGAETTFQQIQQSRGLVHLDAQANVIIGSLASIQAEIAVKNVELQALRSYSTERNPDVQLAERQLSALQIEADQLEQHGHSAGSSGMGLKDIPKAGIEYVRSERDLQYQQSLFDLLLRQYEAARLDEAKEAATIQVVEPAIEPDRASSPKRILVMPFFIAGGFLGGCLLALLAWLRERLESDPESAMQIQFLKLALLNRSPAGG